jgi:cytochrome c556
MKFGTALKSGALVLCATLSLAAMAQNAPPPGGSPPAGGPPGGPGGPGAGGPPPGMPSPAEMAIGYRQAVFTVLAGNFGPIGGVLRGGEYNAAAVARGAERVAFIATLVGDAFPAISKEGKTKAKPEIWTDKEGFAKRVKDLTDSTAALAALVKKDPTNSAAFKTAAGKVGEACKGCHDNYRNK